MIPCDLCFDGCEPLVLLKHTLKGPAENRTAGNQWQLSTDQDKKRSDQAWQEVSAHRMTSSTLIFHLQIKMAASKRIYIRRPNNCMYMSPV